MADYTSTEKIPCDAVPCGRCELSRAQVEMIRKMEQIELLGKKKGGAINAFYKPDQGWLITIKMR